MFDIVMSLYNKEPFVRATVESVIAQNFADWRLIVVDDGSQDDGASIVESFQDPRITFLRQENRGVGPARNTGIAAGSSEWIAFLDSDDIWNPDHLAELDAVRTVHPQAVLVGTGFMRFGGEQVIKQRSPGRSRRRLTRYFAECARGRELFFTSSAAVRRSALAEVGNFKPFPGNEDVELWARLALHGPIAVSTKRTVHYRVGTGGLTDTRTSEGYKPARREDVSSTVPTLDQAMRHLTDPELRQDIVDYIDSRAGLCLVSAVLSGDMEQARRMRALYVGRPRGKARIASGLSLLPTALAQRLVSMGRKLKRTLRPS